MDPHRNERAGLYRLTVPSRLPRSVPDDEFNEIFARLPSHHDGALVAFYVSTGARASELLSTAQGGVDPGRGCELNKGDQGRLVPRASSSAGHWPTRVVGTP